MLQIKPHVGDTLRMRLDQQSEMTGVRRTSAGEASAMVMSSMKMFSRAIVEGSARRGHDTCSRSRTRSCSRRPTSMRRAAAQAAEPQMRGQRVRFRVSPDGTVGMNQAR